MKPPYKGDWRVKEYKPYTEKLEEYVTTMEGQLDVLLAVIARLEENLAAQETVCAAKPLPPLPSPFSERGSTHNDHDRLNYFIRDPEPFSERGSVGNVGTIQPWGTSDTHAWPS